MKQRDCDGCRWCCYIYNVEVPVKRSLKVLDFKSERSHCRHERERGCKLHGTPNQPPLCRDFLCPYLAGVDIHRPDTFEPLLVELGGNMGNYIPAIPRAMSIEFAKGLIRETRTLPAAVLFAGEWVRLVLPLDRQPDGSWETNEVLTARWQVMNI